MFRKIMLLAGVVGMMLAMATARADVIYVSGNVSGTWSADTVIVIGQIQVPSDQTLTINPGVKVLFQVYCKFLIQSGATLSAVGTDSDSILFDEYFSDLGWHGIRFLDSSNNSRLEYCHLTNGLASGMAQDAHGGAIYCDNTNLTVRHCLIDSCSAWQNGGAIYCYQSSPNIEYCTIAHNEAYFGGGIGFE